MGDPAMIPPTYQREGITLYHADCLDVLPQLTGIDAVITDPPYGIGFAAQPTKWQRMAGQSPEAWDDEAFPTAGLLWILGEVKKQVVWGGNFFQLPPSRGWLSWFKPDAPPSMGSFELAWTNQNQNTRQITWSISATNAERVGHPTQKPYRVMAWTLDQVGVTTDATVLDPFTGSGTTGIACIRTGRKFIGIEKELKYFEIARDRIDRELDQGLLAL